MKFNITKRLKDNKISRFIVGATNRESKISRGYETFGANTGTVLGNIGLITMLCLFLVFI